jgi:hypothetical protein
MKVWKSYGSEHSYRLVLIGRFQDETTAAGVEDKITKLQEAVPNLPEPSWERENDRFPDELHDLLSDLKVWDLTRSEIQGMAYDFSVSRKGDTIEIHGDDADVQGFIKLMIAKAAKIEIFSAHDWNDDGERRQPVADDDTTE